MASPLDPVYVLGYPGPVGGACTELWHTLKLWRRYGLEVHLIPTWNSPDAGFRRRCASLGCITHEVANHKDEIAAIPGLAGSTVISFCNEWFFQTAQTLKPLGCPLVWVNCMNWLFDQERRNYAVMGPFDAYVCQSRYQIGKLQPELSSFGVQQKQIHHIPGWIDAEEFCYSPLKHAPGEPFVLGRLSRAAADKFSTNTWSIYDRIDYQPKRVRIMGWAPAIGQTIGKPRDYCEILDTGSLPVPEFMASLHCYCQINGTATENWPRAGLEAMAAGVPIVVERRGGWPEMIEHGKTGFVCSSDAEIAHWAAHLAYDESFRLDIARRAWLHLVRRLADPDDIWDRWESLFRSLAPRPSRPIPNP